MSKKREQMVGLEEGLLCTTKTWIMKPLKLQKSFCLGLPMLFPLRFIDAEDKKLIAIQKSLIARPLPDINQHPSIYISVRPNHDEDRLTGSIDVETSSGI